MTADRYPHCDSRVVHAPGECTYCDDQPTLQIARLTANIAFTGYEPKPGQFPCPADAARPTNTPSDHRRWAGNKPTSATGDATWPRETFASVVLYGDKGGRADWPLRERVVLRVKRWVGRLRRS